MEKLRAWHGSGPSCNRLLADCLLASGLLPAGCQPWCMRNVHCWPAASCQPATMEWLQVNPSRSIYEDVLVRPATGRYHLLYHLSGVASSHITASWQPTTFLPISLVGSQLQVKQSSVWPRHKWLDMAQHNDIYNKRKSFPMTFKVSLIWLSCLINYFS